MPHPNIVFVFGDQHRYQTTGFGGSRQVRTPHMDRLAEGGVVFERAISNIPVCTPWRASLLTGQYPLTTGLFLNDVQLSCRAPSLGTVLRDAGYETGYIGKWHLDGPARLGFTPRGPRRQGFDFWAVCNCTHKYMNSLYYRDTPNPLYWEGYDAESQTSLALEYIRSRNRETPFALVLSYGPPHNPYRQAPDRYLDMYPPETIEVRPNCPNPNREDLSGYYAHVTALDDQLGRIADVLESEGLMDNTIFVYASDHGDMLGSQGVQRKQHPWDEAIRIPFVMRCPGQAGPGHRVAMPFNVVDIMPTLLGLAGVPVPDTVEGRDLSPAVRGEPMRPNDAALIMSIASFSGEYSGPSCWRGVRTERYTYARTLDGPWLLYDNREDPYQQHNLIDTPDHADLQQEMDALLNRMLNERGDEFLPPAAYLERYGLSVDKTGAIPYK